MFESTRQAEVSADHQQLTEFKIERVVEYGKRVRQGQALVWFDSEDWDEKIRDAELDLRLASLALKADEFEHQQFLQQQRLDAGTAKRTRDLAQQQYDNYQKVDRERQIEQANVSLQSAKFSLDSATEEFHQLEQMYEEDDLTEQSEEIVLRRAKHSMEMAQFSLRRSEIQTARTLSQTIPKNDAEQEESLARARLAFESSQHERENQRQKREIELERKQTKFKQQSEDLEQMRSERKQVVLKSPRDGIFLYGPLVRGKLPAKPVVLKQGTSVANRQVIGTVVDPSKLHVRLDLPEAQFHAVSKGDKCNVTPDGLPDVTLEGVVESVGDVPYVNAKYDCVVTVGGKALNQIMPGMNCQVTLSKPAVDDGAAEEVSADQPAAETDLEKKKEKEKAEQKEEDAK
ncbi:HlyD family efflux transporter periplasmic adaptor subunit [Stieleria tagensis]|uniref:HlyD family efflux transporter periplasmic adaptor subunit n=1 Tax=Stieleria tagensis TaxID=2956795 RepID=UPI00209B7AE4|nr:HlyD family secretion protein [Stieleria tagensis]